MSSACHPLQQVHAFAPAWGRAPGDGQCGCVGGAVYQLEDQLHWLEIAVLVGLRMAKALSEVSLATMTAHGSHARVGSRPATRERGGRAVRGEVKRGGCNQQPETSGCDQPQPFRERCAHSRCIGGEFEGRRRAKGWGAPRLAGGARHPSGGRGPRLTGRSQTHPPKSRSEAPYFPISPLQSTRHKQIVLGFMVSCVGLFT